MRSAGACRGFSFEADKALYPKLFPSHRLTKPGSTAKFVQGGENCSAMLVSARLSSQPLV
jgi:hypothetical protein